MKSFVTLILLALLISCDQQHEKTEVKEKDPVDLEKELASIEETRSNFEKAIAEKRYADLGNYSTQDLISLTPVCGEWEEYKNMIENPVGSFSYDSIKMQPKETIVVSDSIAYDFGISSSYYTNSEGEPVEIKASFLAILKKDSRDGVWKLHREVATTNLGK
ncbi:DUF4440 domain-containing protein [Gramella lutea]|uniref:DUF4440 domain-containing protein n=1 Tax=Christiangramia lutea TaxID=1607951 RepID=A0A9X1V4K6_9FLAO|nr:DUF4440 domain-containing protein [Christiangramia lutea]MCH4824402.1 DUF4440 domain-containing protein [Christiangramia lutea]